MTTATFLIYCITHKSSGRKYVGQTRKTLATRWRRHCEAAIRADGRMHITRAINRHGPDAFVVELLEQCQSADELNASEIYWIKLLNTLEPIGFNSMGGGGSQLVSAEVGRKISAALGGRVNGPMSADRRKNISEAKMGHTPAPLSAEQRARLSAALTGRKRSIEHCANLSAAKTGSVASLETRQKMSDAHKKSPRSRAHLAAMSAANIGRRLSAEHRKKISAGQRRKESPDGNLDLLSDTTSHE